MGLYPTGMQGGVIELLCATDTEFITYLINRVLEERGGCAPLNYFMFYYDHGSGMNGPLNMYSCCELIGYEIT